MGEHKQETRPHGFWLCYLCVQNSVSDAMVLPQLGYVLDDAIVAIRRHSCFTHDDSM